MAVFISVVIHLAKIKVLRNQKYKNKREMKILDDMKESDKELLRVNNLISMLDQFSNEKYTYPILPLFTEQTLRTH